MKEKISKEQQIDNLVKSMNVNTKDETFFAIYRKKDKDQTIYFNGSISKLEDSFMSMFVEAYDEKDNGEATQICAAILESMAYILGNGCGHEYGELMYKTLLNVIDRAQKIENNEKEKRSKNNVDNFVVDELRKAGESLAKAMEEMAKIIGQDFKDYKKGNRSDKDKKEKKGDGK